MKKLIPLALILITFYPVCSIFLAACSENNCSIAGREMINCTFYTRSIVTNAIVRDTLDSLTVTALGTDSVIINRDLNVHKISLPLRFTNETTSFVFHYTRTSRDTITFEHTNTPYFLSLECGYETQQVLTGNFRYAPYSRAIDSIAIINLQANTNGKENVEFYMF